MFEELSRLIVILLLRGLVLLTDRVGASFNLNCNCEVRSGYPKGTLMIVSVAERLGMGL